MGASTLRHDRGRETEEQHELRTHGYRSWRLERKGGRTLPGGLQPSEDGNPGGGGHHRPGSVRPAGLVGTLSSRVFHFDAPLVYEIVPASSDSRAGGGAPGTIGRR